MNCGLPVLDMARGRDFLVLTKRSAASGDENGANQNQNQIAVIRYSHEQTICRQLFAGHVVGCRPMERKKKMNQMIM